MPYRLEITGDTLQQLYNDSAGVLMLLMQGAAAQAAQGQQQPAQPGTDSNAVIPGPNPSASDAPPEDAKPKRRGRPPTIDAKPEPKELLDDRVDDLYAERLVTDTPVETKQLTLDDDIRPRIRDINAAHTKRLAGTGDDKKIMNDCVAYIMKLFGRFGIQKAGELKPEKYAEFMAASQAYLDGTAPT